ncbi:MAG: ParA family protein [Gammaproteobacteria bacterium]|nr:ParA family protein [Gammaproteobacteria bacterium]
MELRILAVLNHKGGVGKTTTCFNLASVYASMGLRVLAVDLDPQSHLTVSLGLQDNGLSGVDDIFLEQAAAQDLIINSRDNLDVLPAGYRLGEIERLSAEGRKKARVLENALQSIRHNYDIILLDCPPTSGLLNFNALYTADEIIIPVSSDYLALHGLSELLRTLRSVEKFMQKKLKLWIAITRFTTRRRLSNQVKDKLIKYFPNQLLATMVRECAPLAESPSFGKSIFEYSRRSNGAQDYASLADDILYERVCS